MLQKKEERLPEVIQETCYYKSFKSSRPDPEYNERCKTCNGFPDEGCFRYITKSHVESFYEKYGIQNTDKPIPTGLESLEDGGGFINI
jgi:hypothetical protein